jgi:hypothetical protein
LASLLGASPPQHLQIFSAQHEAMMAVAKSLDSNVKQLNFSLSKLIFLAHQSEEENLFLPVFIFPLCRREEIAENEVERDFDCRLMTLIASCCFRHSMVSRVFRTAAISLEFELRFNCAILLNGTASQ